MSASYYRQPTVSVLPLRSRLAGSIDIDDIADKVMEAGHAVTAAGDTIRIWTRPVPAAMEEIKAAIAALTAHYLALSAIERELEQ
jgi:hypothetical protein